MSILPENTHLPKVSIATCSFAASALLVNAVAFIGQYGYASEHFGWDKPGDVLFAATIESVAVTVAAHAHQSQKNNDSALRTKLASYGLGALVGLLNYSHYAPQWHPTAKAVSLGLLSALSPWLWSMFSRRVSRDLLMERGLLEERAVRLGGTRWSWHPVLAFRAMRWATWLGEQNPSAAITAVENQNQRRAGTRKNRNPEPGLVPELPALPGTGQFQNQDVPDSGTGSGTTKEPELAGAPEPEPQGVPEPEPAPCENPVPVRRENQEPAPAKPETPRTRRKRRDPGQIAAGLVPRAQAFISTWRREHNGKAPTADQLRGELRVSKTTACEVMRLTLAQPPAGHRAI